MAAGSDWARALSLVPAWMTEADTQYSDRIKIMIDDTGNGAIIPAGVYRWAGGGNGQHVRQVQLPGLGSTEHAWEPRHSREAEVEHQLTSKCLRPNMNYWSLSLWQPQGFRTSLESKRSPESYNYRSLKSW